MAHDYRRSDRAPGASTSVTGSVGTLGKRTLTEVLYANAAPVQRKAAAPATEDQVHEAAQRGVAGAGSALPHLDVIQRAFGTHDVSKIQAHTGEAAARASTEIGAQAYATGNHVAFAGAPDLRTTAHEAAHVVQQRAGVHLKGGVGGRTDLLADTDLATLRTTLLGLVDDSDELTRNEARGLRELWSHGTG